MRRQEGIGGSAGYAGVDPTTGEYVVSYSDMTVDIHPTESR